MGSIYKKGRDGYYYYQVYVFNPNTGIKNKKIFHALRTKNYEEAYKKKIKLDVKYSKEKSIIKRLKYFYFIIIIVLAPLIILIMNSSSSKIILNQNVSENIENKDINVEYNFENIIDSLEILNEDLIVKKDFSISEINKSKEVEIVKLPEYEIVRIEEMLSNFEQGKIFLTLDKETSEQSILYLCRSLMIEYKKFSNIVICIYSNDSPGYHLASGENQKVSLDEKKTSWLSMYSYNPVEGEYFDGNPTSYLNSYQ